MSLENILLAHVYGRPFGSGLILTEAVNNITMARVMTAIELAVVETRLDTFRQMLSDGLNQMDDYEKGWQESQDGAYLMTLVQRMIEKIRVEIDELKTME